MAPLSLSFTPALSSPSPSVSRPPAGSIHEQVSCDSFRIGRVDQVAVALPVYTVDAGVEQQIDPFPAHFVLRGTHVIHGRIRAGTNRRGTPAWCSRRGREKYRQIRLRYSPPPTITTLDGRVSRKKASLDEMMYCLPGMSGICGQPPVATSIRCALMLLPLIRTVFGPPSSALPSNRRTPLRSSKFL